VAATPSVKVVKQFGFKGGNRLWSNRYHFNGGTPPDATHWHTLFDAVVAAEKLIFTSYTTIVEVIGYAAGSDVPVASKTYSQAGTKTAVTRLPPGEVAGLIRWATAARTSKNHPVYLFNYYHGWEQSTSSNHDAVDSAQLTVADTYANAWISGFSDGGSVTAVRAGPNGATATGHFTEPDFTHRDFPYTRSDT